LRCHQASQRPRYAPCHRHFQARQVFPLKRKDTRISDRVAEQVADTMFALATPSRVQIIACLLEGPHAVVDIIEALGMEQSAVSHQLRVLRDQALVKAERVGRRRLYALADEHVRVLLEEALHHVQHRGKEGNVARAASGPGA
jgi:DNA-binding transcriptional ArsR family regulator